MSTKLHKNVHLKLEVIRIKFDDHAVHLLISTLNQSIKKILLSCFILSVSSCNKKAKTY